MAALPQRWRPLLALQLLCVSLPPTAAVDYAMKIQQTVGSTKIAVQSSDFDKAILKVEEISKLADEWRLALLSKKQEVAAAPAAEEPAEPPTETIEFSVNRTFIPDVCRRQSQQGSTMKVHYVGKLLQNNKIFASSFHTGSQPFRFVLGSKDVLPAWNEGLEDMCVGERRRLLVPWSKGYGQAGSKGVPPYSDLQFDFELVELGSFKSQLKRDEL